MKRFLIVYLISLICVSVSFSQTDQKEYIVKVQSENFRIEPSGDILGKLNAGTKVKAIKEEGNWIKIQIEGYIWKPSVTTDPTDVVGYKIHAMHILLKTEAEANDVLQKLKNGGNFNDLAAQYSIDPSVKKNKGDLGAFSKGDLLKEFEDAVLRVKPGETSGVVKSSLGYHIIKRIK